MKTKYLKPTTKVILIKRGQHLLASYVVRPEGRLTRRNAKHFSFGMIFNERAAVFYNFSPRYFAGATLTMSNSFYDNDVTVNQNKWRARAFVGLRL